MLRFIILAVLICGTLTQEDNSDVFGCYHINWFRAHPLEGKVYPPIFPFEIDPHLCTHLFYCCANIADDVLAPTEWYDESTDQAKGMFERFNDLKMENPDLKTLLSVGMVNGKTQNLTRLAQVMGKQVSREKFVRNSISYLRRWNFDGLDIHWQYPMNTAGSLSSNKAEYKRTFTKLLQELKAAFEAESIATDSESLLLTVAVAPDKKNMRFAYNIPGMQASVDFINLKTYDMRGPWEKSTGHHATTRPDPLDTPKRQRLTVEWVANEWLRAGAPAHKLVLGMATHGRAFLLAGRKSGINAKAQGAPPFGSVNMESGIWSYYEICQKLLDLNQHFVKVEDPVRQIIYAHNSKEWSQYGDDDMIRLFNMYSYNTREWVGYEDVTSIENKGAIIHELGLRGGMVWALDFDDYRGLYCGQGTWPLTRKTHSMILGNTTTAASTAPPTAGPVTEAPIGPTDAPPAGPATDAPPAGPTTDAPPAGPTTDAPPAGSATDTPPAATPYHNSLYEIVPVAPCSPQYMVRVDGEIRRIANCCDDMYFYNTACGCCDLLTHTPDCSPECYLVPDGGLVASQLCSPTYFRCDGGKIIKSSSCSSGYVFDDETKSCQPISNTPTCSVGQ